MLIPDNSGIFCVSDPDRSEASDGGQNQVNAGKSNSIQVNPTKGKIKIMLCVHTQQILPVTVVESRMGRKRRSALQKIGVDRSYPE
jgi:hypothetical protein